MAGRERFQGGCPVAHKLEVYDLDIITRVIRPESYGPIETLLFDDLAELRLEAFRRVAEARHPFVVYADPDPALFAQDADGLAAYIAATDLNVELCELNLRDGCAMSRLPRAAHYVASGITTPLALHSHSNRLAEVS